MTIADLVKQHAERTPGAVAMREKHRGIWREITWRDYWRTAETVARALRTLGVCFGLFHVELWLTDDGIVLGELHGRTRLFINRPYDWKVVDVMMTNFHLPRTTLLMMIDAFIGDL